MKLLHLFENRVTRSKRIQREEHDRESSRKDQHATAATLPDEQACYDGSSEAKRCNQVITNYGIVMKFVHCVSFYNFFVANLKLASQMGQNDEHHDK